MQSEIVIPHPQVSTSFVTHPIQGVVAVVLLPVIFNAQPLMTVSQDTAACLSSTSTVVAAFSAVSHVPISTRSGMNGLQWALLLGNVLWTSASLVMTAQALRNVSGML